MTVEIAIESLKASRACGMDSLCATRRDSGHVRRRGRIRAYGRQIESHHRHRHRRTTRVGIIANVSARARRGRAPTSSTSRRPSMGEFFAMIMMVDIGEGARAVRRAQAPAQRQGRGDGAADRRPARGRLQVHAPRLERPTAAWPIQFSPAGDPRNHPHGADGEPRHPHDHAGHQPARLRRPGPRGRRDEGLRQDLPLGRAPRRRRRRDRARVRHPDRQQAHLGDADRAGRRSLATPTTTSPFAETLDRAAHEVGVDFIGGFSALVHKGMTPRRPRR